MSLYLNEIIISYWTSELSSESLLVSWENINIWQKDAENKADCWDWGLLVHTSSINKQRGEGGEGGGTGTL